MQAGYSMESNVDWSRLTHIALRVFGVASWLPPFGRVILRIFQCGMLMFLIILFIRQPQVPIDGFIMVVLGWALIIYLLIVDIVRHYVGPRLIRWCTARPTRWIKEMEYPYLALGVVGVLLTINRMPKMTGTIPNLDLVGPIVLITAVALKCVRTGAEVYEWHKPENLSPPAERKKKRQFPQPIKATSRRSHNRHIRRWPARDLLVEQALTA
jgi:hypothetical protein